MTVSTSCWLMVRLLLVYRLLRAVLSEALGADDRDPMDSAPDPEAPAGSSLLCCLAQGVLPDGSCWCLDLPRLAGS